MMNLQMPKNVQAPRPVVRNVQHNRFEYANLVDGRLVIQLFLLNVEKLGKGLRDIVPQITNFE